MEVTALTKDKEILKLQKEAPGLIEKVSDLKINSGKALEQGSALTAMIRRKKDEIEERRKFFVGPLNNHIKAINVFFHALTDPLKEADGILIEKMLAWRSKEAEKIAKKNEAMAERGVPLGDGVDPLEQKTATESGTFRKYWTFEVVDAKAVPKAYWKVDEGAISEAVDSGTRVIPGVKIFEKEMFARR